MDWMKFGRKKESTTAKTVVDSASCLHAALAPRWDRAEDIGHDDRASSFRCDACQTIFTADEVAVLREREAERLRELLKS